MYSPIEELQRFIGDKLHLPSVGIVVTTTILTFLVVRSMLEIFPNTRRALASKISSDQGIYLAYLSYLEGSIHLT